MRHPIKRGAATLLRFGSYRRGGVKETGGVGGGGWVDEGMDEDGEKLAELWREDGKPNTLGIARRR